MNEALKFSHVPENLKVTGTKEFESAKNRFKSAREKATEAFSNEALSIEDKIFAVKIRIASEILECLDSPDIAITGCLYCLKELHSLPVIRNIFTVYLNDGIKSKFCRGERAENVMAVMLINSVLFEYVSHFGSKYPFVFDWPTIELADRNFNPILSWKELSTRKSMGKNLTRHPSGLIFDEEMPHYCPALNGYGDVVVGEPESTAVLRLKVISKTGEKNEFEFPNTHKEGEVVLQYIKGFAVANDGNVHVVTLLENYTVKGGVEYSYVLSILDENYNVKQVNKLHFFEATAESYYDHVGIAVDKNMVVVCKENDQHLYICDNEGSLKRKFTANPTWPLSLSISNKNEIILPSSNRQAVHIYSEEGILKSTIQLPRGHEIRGVAFHFAFERIIVRTHVEKKESFFLLCYAEAGELETSTYFCKKSKIDTAPQITSHSNGPFAIVTSRSITFI